MNDQLFFGNEQENILINLMDFLAKIRSRCNIFYTIPRLKLSQQKNTKMKYALSLPVWCESYCGERHASKYLS